ncbi:MAG: DUF4910 domain-containing protein [Campylobacterales bacterium]|nr:DUF4910 domain-containing protein [Campylobacterales bacterium]
MYEPYENLKKLYNLKLAPNSPDTDKFVEIAKQILPFKLHEFDSGLEFNGWVVPYSWSVKKALIKKDGVTIYDGLHHPLAVIGYSQSFIGKISLSELKKHIWTHPTLDDALVYHCDLFYKVGKQEWGFTMSKNMLNSLLDGEYEIELECSFEQNSLKVLEFDIKGEIDEYIILNAHNCHAQQANDDISGVVVGIEIMKRLMQTKNRYSYKLIIAPEHFGTIFYLASLELSEIKKFKHAMFLESLGNDKHIGLQLSFLGNKEIDIASINYISNNFNPHEIKPFRQIIGNDETVWEAAGYEIPCISLSRHPFREYHSSFDNIDIISIDRLKESVKIVEDIIKILETNRKMKRKFNGLIALSNPKYNLYIAPGSDPTGGIGGVKVDKKFNYLMDCIIRYFDENMTILDIATKHEMDYFSVYEYVKMFEEKELIEFV